MKKAIIYKTRRGATKQYAKWLKEEIEADLFTYKDFKKGDFEKYDLYVIASGTYASMMPLTKYIKKNWKHLKDKKVVLMADGAAPADDSYSKISYKRIPEEIRKKVIYFKLPSGMDEEKRKEVVKKENLEPVIKAIQELE